MPNCVNAQQAQPPEKPRGAPAIKLNLADVVKVEPAPGAEQSVYVVAARRQSETQSRLVPVTRTRTETRTRTVVVDGKQVEQTYQVAVPFTVHVQQKFTKPGTKPTVISASKLSAWDLQGKRVPTPMLMSRLKAPVSGFLLSRPWREGATIDPLQLAVLKEDLLLIHMASQKQQADDANDEYEVTLPR